MARDTDEVLEVLRQRGYRMTTQRRAIVNEIVGTRGHITPVELVGRVRERWPGIDESTVYRTLDLLEDVGVISRAHLGDAHEYHHADEHDHVHLVCSQCGRRDRLSARAAEPLRALMREVHGFDPDLTHSAIWGRCRRCSGR